MGFTPRCVLGLFFAIVMGLLAILPVERPSPSVCGRVFENNSPAVDATVRWQGTQFAVVTDNNGFFRLPGVKPGRRITASKEGFLIAGATSGSPLHFHLTPLPPDDNEDYVWVDPTPLAGDSQRCGNCHAEAYREWSASGHAHSAVGRHFRNLYEGTDWHGAKAGWGLLNEHPDGAGVCAACHAPALPPGDPARFDMREIGGVASKGVHCDYCHKIAGVERGEIGLGHGAFNLRLLRPAAGQLFFGPLDDVDRGEDAYSSLYRDSRYCASCHEGTVFGVPVYTTWSEWLDSPARREGKQCQDCHMKPTGLMTNIAPGHGGLERRPHTLSNHTFFDGSREKMLRDCLKLTTRVERREDGLKLEVGIFAERVGHRVPTGFIDHHLILWIEGRDGSGRPVEPKSGPRLPAAVGPILAARPGRLFAKLLTDVEGRSPAPFWRPGSAIVDSRLRPEQRIADFFEFPVHVSQIRVQLIDRRFWAEVSQSKSWPNDDLSVVDKLINITGVVQPIQPGRFNAK